MDRITRAIAVVVAVLLGNVAASVAPVAAVPPASVTVAGSFQSELGCPGDWQPDCATTHLTRAAATPVWRAGFGLPAGDHGYKIALNDGWSEYYPVGANLVLSLSAASNVRFYFDEDSHWIADSVNDVIATLAGSFQSELGCPGDWQPDCLASLLQDVDGDGVSSFSTETLPAGSYQALVTHDESWSEYYGVGGVRNGPEIAFVVPPGGATMTFSYHEATHVLTIARPDARIRRGLRASVGNDIYNNLTGQTVNGSTAPGRSVTFSASVQNDARIRDTLRLQGQGSTPRFGVVYRDPAGVNVTGEVTDGTYTTPNLLPGATHQIRAVVTVRDGAPRHASLARTIAAISTTQLDVKDTVRFVTTRA